MTLKSLRSLIRKPITRRMIDKITQEAFDETDERSAIIVNVALMEAGLARLIKSRLRKLNKEDENMLFGPRGSFGGFASKIRAAYAMGIIGPRTRNDLVAINDIRNVFAHAPYHVKFQWNKKLKNRVLDIHMFQFVRAQHRDLSHQQCFLQTLSLYAMFIARDRHKRIKPPQHQTTFLGYKSRMLLM
jgi:hypothetical protein